MYFLFNDTATTENYTYCNTLTLHDALPIWPAVRDEEQGMPLYPDGVEGCDVRGRWRALLSRLAAGAQNLSDQACHARPGQPAGARRPRQFEPADEDRKSTRLNSSH